MLKKIGGEPASAFVVAADKQPPSWPHKPTENALEAQILRKRTYLEP